MSTWLSKRDGLVALYFPLHLIVTIARHYSIRFKKVVFGLEQDL